MGIVSKAALCVLVVAAAAKIVVDQRVRADIRRKTSQNGRRSTSNVALRRPLQG
jgi:hypothetical protein